MLPAELERLAGSVLVGATPAMDAGTHPVAVAEAQMLLAPPQLGLNACPDRARKVKLVSQPPTICESTPWFSQCLPFPIGNWYTVVTLNTMGTLKVQIPLDK